MTRVGIIICDRWSTCAGGKCLRALQRREGAFQRYKDGAVELVGYTTCGGCPGGNVEYAPAEMKKNGADVVLGTHPIPRNYYVTHTALGTRSSTAWQERTRDVICDGPTRSHKSVGHACGAV